jgi:hypothetical protein
MEIGIGNNYNSHAGNTMLVELDANFNGCIEQIVENCAIGMY